MQEEVEHRTVALSISTAKLTANVLKNALSKYLVYRKQHTKSKIEVIPHGKQTVKELVGQNQGVTNIEIDDGNIKVFERTARKYGVDFAVMKDKSGDMPKYLVFFKSRDERQDCNSDKGMENGVCQADSREENAQRAVSCFKRRSERSRANPQERLQYLAAGTAGTATTQGARCGAIKERAAG